MLLGQLDGVRRELVEVVGRWAPHIMFGKELVREVLAFAQVRALAAVRRRETASLCWRCG